MNTKSTFKRVYIRAVSTTLSVALIASSGCSLCCPPYLDDYATVGGKWARSNPTEGRVGSAFSDPGTMVHSTQDPIYPQSESANPVFDEEMQTHGEPSTINEPLMLGDDW